MPNKLKSLSDTMHVIALDASESLWSETSCKLPNFTNFLSPIKLPNENNGAKKLLEIKNRLNNLEQKIEKKIKEFEKKI